MYDLGLWIFIFLYVFYWLSIIGELIDWIGGKYFLFKVVVYIYGFGMVLVFYWVLFGYIKWVYFLNVFEENKDRLLCYRIVLGVLIFGIIIIFVGLVV